MSLAPHAGPLTATFRRDRRLETVEGDDVAVVFTDLDAHTVRHGLAVVPTGWLVLKQDREGVIYATADDEALWTTSVLVVRCTNANLRGTIRVI